MTASAPSVSWHSRPGLVRLSDEAIDATRWAARGTAMFALGAFAILVIQRGAPRSPSAAEWEASVQYLVLAVVAVGCLIAWRWEGVGGWIITACSVALGSLASFSYEPRVALVGCLAFFVPGVLFLIHWQHHRSRIAAVVIGVAMAGFLTTGAVASSRIYDYFNGPSHPESSVARIPVDLVEWVWAGAVDAQGFTVTARLADPDVGIPELVVSAVDSPGQALTFPLQVGPSPERGVVEFRATGLTPNTAYRYAVRVGDRTDEGRAGTVRTFPAASGGFTVAFASCARTGSNGQVYDRIRESSPAVYIVSGDIHYENISTADADRMRDALDDVLGAPAQQALYLSAPIAYVWDDHDFGGNGSDSTTPSRPAAEAVYREYVPHYPLPGGADAGPVYQAFSIGHVRFILTDTRSQRSPAGDTEDPSRTMLGAQQKAWLKAELLAARDTHALIVWVNSIPWIAPEGDGRDDWGGYAVERRELSDFIVQSRITNLAMLSGDAHMLAIDDGSNNRFASDGDGPGFPVFHAAALDRRGKVKGGPYSEGAFPGGGQFGLMTVTDDGAGVTVEWTGLDYRGEMVVSYSFAIPRSRAPGGH